MEQLTVEIVNHVKSAKPLARIKRVAHKICGPGLVRLMRHEQGLFNAFRQPLLGATFLIQAQFAIDAIDPFMVPTVALAQILEAFPKTPAGMLVDHRVNGLDDFGITIMPSGDLVIGRPREFETATTALHRQTMLGNQVRHGVAFVRRP